MKQQPDKLFQEKLSHYGKPVPAQVWEQLATQLDKKKSRPIWLKIAASILLMGVAASLLWPLTQFPEPHTIAGNPIPAPTQADPRRNPQNEAPAPLELLKNTPAPLPPSTPESIPQENKPMQQKKLARSAKPSPLPEVTNVQQPEIPSTEEFTTQQPVADLHSVEVIPEKRDQSLTLIFTAAETQAYLDNKTNDEATSTDKNPSTLKRLVKKATALKNNQDAFGELREMKNEIFALNRSERRREQNK